MTKYNTYCKLIPLGGKLGRKKRRKKVLFLKRTKIKSAAPHSAPEVMDIQALASYLGLGKSKIYALIRQKKIPASRIGRQYRFSKVVIDQWLAEKLITKNSEAQMQLFQEKTQK